MRERWLAIVSIYKEIENFLQNMAIKDADPSLVVKRKSLGKRPLTQTQQAANDADQDYKHKSRLVICGNFAAWGEHSTTTTNLDALLNEVLITAVQEVWKTNTPEHLGPDADCVPVLRFLGMNLE